MIPRGVRRLFRLDKGRADLGADVDAELEFHEAAVVQELIAGGMSEAEARAEAARRLAGLKGQRERLVRIDAGHERWDRLVDRLGGFWQDVRLELRGLVREPAFTLTVAVTLALGIGANGTMVGLVDRLLFRPPAQVQDAERVVQLGLSETHTGFGRFTNTGLAWPDYVLASEIEGFRATAAFYTAGLTLGRGEGAERVNGTLASSTLFPLLGVRPALGRFFTAEDDAVGGGEPVVVLSERFWRRRFGGDPAVLGSTLQLGRGSFTVIGVAPAGFTGIELEAVDVWLPIGTGAPEFLGPSTEWSTTRDWQWVRVIGRLADGRPAPQVAELLTTRFRRLVAERPELGTGAAEYRFELWGVHPGDGPEAPRGTRIAGWLALVSFAVLLITCANVANLLLARGARRRRELAVRLALGVRRGRLVGQLVMGAGILAAIGGLLGLAVVGWGGVAIRTFLLPNIDFPDAPLDGRTALLTAAAALLTVVLAGVVPAFQATRGDLALSLKAAGGAGRSQPDTRLRRLLLITQTALSVVLLFGAGLFVKSLRSVVDLDLGFDPRPVLAASVELTERGVSREDRARLADRLEVELARLPGVEAITQAIAVPFQTRYSVRLKLPGRDSVPRLSTGTPSYNAGSPQFFDALGMRILRGRPFQPSDNADASPVIVVNETMARTFWPGTDPIGQCVLIGADSLPPCAQVVGVVADSRREELVEQPTMQYYAPIAQAPMLGFSGDRSIFLRVSGEPDRMVEPVRRAIIAAAPEVSWARVRPIAQYLEPQLQPWRLGAGVFGIFGLLALLVAAVGLYGSLAYSVATRAREFGVRGALGAGGGRLIRLVIGEGLRITLVGLVIGGAMGLMGGRIARALLFDTSPYDPWVLVAVVVTLGVTAVVASLVPARRAARVDPAEALRAE
ncbi:MAG: ADOP family duplicated permease [Gemmatimonadales bacterium]